MRRLAASDQLIRWNAALTPKSEMTETTYMERAAVCAGPLEREIRTEPAMQVAKNETA
jgi:hypothetical protein